MTPKPKYPKTKSVNASAPKRSKSVKEGDKVPELSTLSSWYQFAEQAARKKHWDFFVLDQFLRGNQNITGDPNNNTITVARVRQDYNFPINLTFATFRAVRGFVTKHRPIVEVEVSESTEEAKTYARRAGKILDRDNQLNNFPKINKEWVYYGVKYGLGWRQLGYDTEKQCAIRWSVDPFDLLPGTTTGKLADAPFVIKTLVRTVGYWRRKYPKCNVAADNFVAADEFKRLALEINFNQTGGEALPTDEQTAIGKECWYRVTQKNKYGGFINKILFTDNDILSFEETPYTEYPFIAYESEITPNEIYPDGHLKHIIAPQRLLNILNTQLLEYNHLINRGRFAVPKGSGFNQIIAKEGQLIFHKQGKAPIALPIPALNGMIGTQMQYAMDWIDHIGANTEVSRGNSPYSGASGEAIKALQFGDENSISDLRSNFEDALAQEATWILKLYSLFEKDGFKVTDESVEEEQGAPDEFEVLGTEAYKAMDKEMGLKYYDDGSYCDVCAVLPDNRVKVSVTSQLGETKEARFELLKELVALGVPIKVLLDHLEFPNADDVLERIASESVGAMMMESMQQGMAAPMEGGMPPPPPPGNLPPPPPLEALAEIPEGLSEDELGLLNATAEGILGG